MFQDKFVCGDCIEDNTLRVVVQNNATSTHCSYCERSTTEPFACELSIVLEQMKMAIDREYTDPANELPYETREGGYIGEVIEGARELFDRIGFFVNDESLYESICDYFEGFYCEVDYFGPSQAHVFGSMWGRFRRVVRHLRRYTFWNSEELPDMLNDPASGMSVGETIQIIARNIECINPYIEMPVGSKLWRVRVFDKGKSSSVSKEYTSPPHCYANQPNRMSPAGIPMFYSAEDFETAIEETVEKSPNSSKEATGVEFETITTLNLLDLTNISEPSFFEDVEKYVREAYQFVLSFAREVSQPIMRDGRQHIEYVPTQVFTEYVRFEMTTPNGDQIHGLKYRSSKNGKNCYVVFAEQEDCLRDIENRLRPQLLQFVENSFRTQMIADL